MITTPTHKRKQVLNSFPHIDNMSKEELKNLVKIYKQYTNKLLEILEDKI